MDGIVAAASRSPTPAPTKRHRPGIRLTAGLGVTGDAHRGRIVKHRSRVARDPSRPDPRPFPPIHAELFAELEAAGFVVGPGLMAATLVRDAHGRLVRKAGIRAIVLRGGGVKRGDPIRVILPPPPHHRREPV